MSDTSVKGYPALMHEVDVDWAALAEVEEAEALALAAELAA